MPLRTDDDVVMHNDVHPLSGFENVAGQIDVGTAWLRITTGMIVHKNDSGSTQVHGAVNHLPDVDIRRIDGPLTQNFVSDQRISRVHIENANAFEPKTRHVGAKVVDERLPTREYRLVSDARLCQAQGACLRNLECRGDRFAHAIDAHERVCAG